MWSWSHLSTSGPRSGLALGTRRGQACPWEMSWGASRKDVQAGPGMDHSLTQNLEQSSSFIRTSLHSLASWQCEGLAQHASIPTKCTNNNAHVGHCLSVIGVYWFFSSCCYLALNPTYMLVWLRKGRTLVFILCLLCSRHSDRDLICIITF